jgi:hypothetical protein
MPKDFEPVLLPRDDEPSEKPSKKTNGFRFQKTTLSIALAILGPLLIGGVLTEIFHTGQVYSSAVASYSTKADEATKRGLDLLTREIAEGITKATISKVSASAEARRRLGLAEVEADRLSTKTSGDISSSMIIAQSVRSDIFVSRRNFVTALFKVLESARKTVKGGNLGIGLRYNDPENAFNGVRVFSIPHEPTPYEIDRVCAIECVRYDWNSDRCVDTWEKREGGSATSKEPISSDAGIADKWKFKLSASQRQQLSLLRQNLRDLEAMLFQSALDLERDKKANPMRPEAKQRWMNTELARLYQGLQNVRKHVNVIGEIEYLASSSQRSSLVAAYHAKDLWHVLNSGAASEFNEQSLSRWIDLNVEKQIEITLQDLHHEHAAASSWEHWVARPGLANLWFLSHWGRVYPMRVFSSHTASKAAASFVEPHASETDSSVSSWLVLIPLMLVLILTAVVAAKFSKVAIAALLVLVGLTALVGVNSALQANRVTEDIASSMATEVIESVEAYSFEKRGAELKMQIETHTEQVSRELLADAEIQSGRIIARPEKISSAYEKAPNCAGLSATLGQGTGWDRLEGIVREEIAKINQKDNPDRWADLQSIIRELFSGSDLLKRHPMTTVAPITPEILRTPSPYR